MWSWNFPPAPKYSADDVPDMTGKVVFITGGSSGIGKELARVLITKNAKVYIAGRSMKKSQEAIEELKTATGKSEAIVQAIGMDLSDLASVKAGVDDFLSKESRLDVLYNNGGVMNRPHSELTKDGLDIQFATNVLGHFYLTKLLMPTLLASAKTAPEGKVRVIEVSGGGVMIAPSAKVGGPVVIDSLIDGPTRNKFDAQTLFCQSKSGQALHAMALSRRFADQGIVCISLHPGIITTPLWNEGNNKMPWLKKMSYGVEYGALTPLYAGTSTDALEFNGKFLVPWARVGECRSDHYNVAVQDAMWNWCEEAITKYGPK
ncbi:NAD(P)-binding protein [Clavulina sp. PMI_390]|nr:NAD(P)-binding protein [Clavulina sp. PMI_390]